MSDLTPLVDLNRKGRQDLVEKVKTCCNPSQLKLFLEEHQDELINVLKIPTSRLFSSQ